MIPSYMRAMISMPTSSSTCLPEHGNLLKCHILSSLQSLVIHSKETHLLLNPNLSFLGIYISNFVDIFVSGTYLKINCKVDFAIGCVLVYISKNERSVGISDILCVWVIFAMLHYRSK